MTNAEIESRLLALPELILSAERYDLDMWGAHRDAERVLEETKAAIMAADGKSLGTNDKERAANLLLKTTLLVGKVDSAEWDWKASQLETKCYEREFQALRAICRLRGGDE